MQQVDAVNKVNVAAWICFFFPGRTVSAAAVVTTISAMMSRRRVVNQCLLRRLEAKEAFLLKGNSRATRHNEQRATIQSNRRTILL